MSQRHESIDHFAPGRRSISHSPSGAVAPRAEASDPVAFEAWAGAARVVSMVLLSLLPVLLWHRSLGPFSYCKNALLQLGNLALVAIGAGAAWCCSWTQLRVVGLRLVREPLVVAVLLGLVAATASTLFSTYPVASWRGFSDHRNGLSQVLCLDVCFFACRLSWGSERVPSGFAAALIGLGLAGGYAVGQVLGLDPVPWLDESVIGPQLRPTGAVGHTNTLAALIVLMMPLLVYLAVRTWGDVASPGRTIRLLSQGALGGPRAVAPEPRSGRLAGPRRRRFRPARAMPG